VAGKKKGVKIFFAFVVFLFIAFLILLTGYLYFETDRLSLYGTKPFSDVKSYAASIMKKVPLLGSKISYKPLNVVPYQQLLERKLASFQSVLDSQAASLNSQRIELENLKIKMKSLQITLDASESELKTKIKAFDEKAKAQQNYEHRLQTLEQWIVNSDPVKIGQILANSKLPINVFVDVLTNLSPKTAGTVLQSIAQVNPTLASSVIDTLAGGKK